MDFFKSVFSDEIPNSPPSPDPQSSSPSQTLISDTSPNSSSSSDDGDAAGHGGGDDGGGGGGWSFGGLIQTLASKSETIIETYRRDLQEFNDGLKSETQVLKTVAASKAQVSLESVGKAVDSLGAAVSEIIFHGGDDKESPENQSSASASREVAVKYSRFEAQLRMIQMDEKTYVEENLEDGEKEEFERWKLGFDLGENAAEIEELLRREENGVAAIYERVVPSLVDRETFWLRYFYRVWRLKKAEFVRAKLVKRAINGEDEEEELSWDVDDDNDNDNNDNVVGDHKEDVSLNAVSNVSLKKENDNDNDNDKVTDVPVKEGDSSTEKAVYDNVEVKVKKDEAKEVELKKDDAKEVELKKDEAKEVELKKDEAKEVELKKDEAKEGSKDSEVSVVSNQKSLNEGDEEEEEVGWDEIEDVESGDDERKGSSRVESSGKLVSVVAEDDEDLSWDIEDDDEPIKTSSS